MTKRVLTAFEASWGRCRRRVVLCCVVVRIMQLHVHQQCFGTPIGSSVLVWPEAVSATLQRCTRDGPGD